MAGKTVVAEEGSYAEELLKSKAKDVKVVPVRDTEAGIKLVAEGKADALVASKIVASFFITHNYGAKLNLPVRPYWIKTNMVWQLPTATRSL